MTDPTTRLAHRPLHGVLRASPWHGRSDAVVLAPVPGSRPRSDDVRQAVARLAEAGVTEVFTPALAPVEQPAFASAAFGHHEHLHLLRHPLDRLPDGGGVSLRRGWWRDYPTVLDLDGLAFDDFWRFDRHALTEARAATPTGRFRVATGDGGTVVGYAVTGAGHPMRTPAEAAPESPRQAPRGQARRRRTAYLQRLAVHPDHQGRGTGTALVADALGWARRRGADELLVNTQEHNDGALRLYLRLGFAPQPDGLDVLRWSA